MAAIPSVETVAVTINDVEIQVPKGELIVESVKRLGLEIPIFCYHPRMKAVGMCRMCLVEVGFKGPDGTIKKMPKPQAACTLPASDGMAVYTDSEALHTDRRGVLEFLLINHPLDCPICDRGGECPLQNNTLFYGPSTSRFVELKRHLPKAYPLSKYVTLDLERCIQCGRCVRFTEEISGDAQLAFRFRGSAMQPSTFELRDFTSKFSGNVIEICPVGALTSSQYRFRARPWDLETKPAVCTICSNGCNVWFDYRVGKMVRVNGRTNDAVNEEWTCDKGKFGHDFYNSAKRLATPLIRRNDSLVQTDWAGAYGAIIDAFSGQRVAALGGNISSNEELYLLQKLFREIFGSNNLDHRWQKTLQRYEDRLEQKIAVEQVRDSIQSFESRPAILLFGTSLADEEPILFLRIRKAWFLNGAKVVVAHHEATEADSFAHLVLRYKKGTENQLAQGLLHVAVNQGGMAVSDSVKGALSSFTPDSVSTSTGIRSSDIVEAGMILASNAAAIVTTRKLLDIDDAQAVIEGLGLFAKASKGSFNLYALEANDQGAEDLGILPDMLPGGTPIPEGERGLNTQQILEACANGEIDALWLSCADPFERHPDRDLVQRALENVPFLVYQGILESEAMNYASVVLPAAAPAEEDGSYTNLERRVQRLAPVLATKGQAKAGWKVLAELLMRLKTSKPYFNAGEIMAEIHVHVPWMSADIYNDWPTAEAPITPGQASEALPVG